MVSICGSDCCAVCPRLADCGGCQKTGGHPFGGECVAAQCITSAGHEGFSVMKKSMAEAFNSLAILGLRVDDLNLLNGFYVNLEYHLPNGQSVKLLEDNKVYLGNQIEQPCSERCYGVVGDEHHLLVCTYGCNGADPEIICYKRWR